ncbi:anhydro-N-acetylmuramic acid kinase [Falsirhodobacter halotolerans]|uniref:anhydro-N-acetylmuramic acid kinase n=1 Tax=Falsirhodobacter halotolerans TaxID=1146892 RepID=UPI001FCF7DBB|nr:anhydro-N-acetylmuramic acid kinase [Falsirhodobacter halotolerans]MCJ8139448.1 anhydro-N-acetylmuramic acid kinase [Falsirhodobacter halotolerans]
MLKSGPVWALGAMSGTSLDGVDAAMVLTDGDRILEFGRSAYRAYDDAEHDVLRAALGLWEGAEVAAATQVVERVHAEVLSGFPEAEIVGFHGQTLAHDPRGRGTLQVGSGEGLAAGLGRPVAWDFRSHDVRMGGQGAPLAPFFHHACARWSGMDRPVAFVNLGGVGNITWLDPRRSAPDMNGALLAFDTGPANAPINDLMRARRGLDADIDGALAGAGKVDEGVLSAFTQHAYFRDIPPKSLDRNDFHGILRAVDHLSDGDACATLTRCAVEGVALALDHAPVPVDRVLVTGGGRKNRTMMDMLAQRLQADVHGVEAFDLDGDMLEAQAFAYLAVRVARGMTLSAPMTTGVPQPVTGGRMAWPPG